MAYYSDPIDPISSKKEKNPYAHIREIQAYLEEVHSLEIEAIILTISERDSNNQLGRKAIHVSSRALMQMLLEKTSQEKAKMHQEAAGISWQAVQAALQVLSAAASPTAKGFFEMAAGACASSAGASEKNLSARISMHEHLYQNTQANRQDCDQGKQSAEHALEQSANLMDKMIQLSRRLSEMVAS